MTDLRFLKLLKLVPRNENIYMNERLLLYVLQRDGGGGKRKQASRSMTPDSRYMLDKVCKS